jgi:hypothetical protein
VGRSDFGLAAGLSGREFGNLERSAPGWGARRNSAVGTADGRRVLGLVGAGDRGPLRTLHVKPPQATVDFVELKGSIDAAPKVVVPHRHELPKTLPLPILGSPIGQPTAESAAHVAAVCNERYARRLIDCFKPADQGEQFESFVAGDRFDVGSRQTVAASNLGKNKPPRSLLAGDARLGKQQEMGAGIGGHGLRLGRRNG